MIKGLHTSAQAMRQGIIRQEITANNLASAGTTAFKRDRLFARELVAASEGQSDPLTVESARWTDFASGAFNPTGDSLDFALQNRGFFVLSDGQTEYYTRNGHFGRNADGLLVDALGRALQGEGGNITLPSGIVTVSSDGRTSVNVVVERFRVADFESPQTLQKAAGSGSASAGAA